MFTDNYAKGLESNQKTLTQGLVEHCWSWPVYFSIKFIKPVYFLWNMKTVINSISIRPLSITESFLFEVIQPNNRVPRFNSFNFSSQLMAGILRKKVRFLDEEFVHLVSQFTFNHMFPSQLEDSVNLTSNWDLFFLFSLTPWGFYVIYFFIEGSHSCRGTAGATQPKRGCISWSSLWFENVASTTSSWWRKRHWLCPSCLSHRSCCLAVYLDFWWS